MWRGGALDVGCERGCAGACWSQSPLGGGHGLGTRRGLPRVPRLTGDCLLYRSLGLSTAKRAYAVSQRQGLGVEESVIINATPEDLYAFWRNLKNLPRFMSHLESVENRGGGRSHWTTRGPAGTTVEWDAEIVGDVAGELLSWRSLPGAMVPKRGRGALSGDAGRSEYSRAGVFKVQPAGRRVGRGFRAAFWRGTSATDCRRPRPAQNDDGNG